MEVDKEIRQAIATGRVFIGADKSLKALKRGQAKLVIVSTNCKPEFLADVQQHAKLANVQVHMFKGDSRELGLSCGKPFLVSILAVVEEGSSGILGLGAGR